MENLAFHENTTLVDIYEYGKKFNMNEVNIPLPDRNHKRTIGSHYISLQYAGIFLPEPHWVLLEAKLLPEPVISTN